MRDRLAPTSSLVDEGERALENGKERKARSLFWKAMEGGPRGISDADLERIVALVEPLSGRDASSLLDVAQTTLRKRIERRKSDPEREAEQQRQSLHRDRGDFPEPVTRLSPAGVFGVILALVGAVAMVIAVFLPMVDVASSTFFQVAENTLIQSGDGFFFLGAAAVVASTAIFAIWRRSAPALVLDLVVALGAVALALHLGTDSGSLTLYPLDASGAPLTDAPGTQAAAGLGIWVAGIGAALAALGCLRILTAPRESLPSEHPARKVTESQPIDGVERLERLARLRQSEMLTEEEFVKEKQRSSALEDSNSLQRSR